MEGIEELGNVPDCVIVLAAGEGSRMKSPLPKVLHRAGGRTMIDWVLTTLKRAGVGQIITVTGFGRESVEAELEERHPDSKIAIQWEQLGTGHAVQSALPLIPPDSLLVGVFSGDTPLLTPGIVHDLAFEHETRKADATILTAELSDPSGYGRVVRDGEEFVERIVEEKDADQEVLKISEINAGAYVYNRSALNESLAQVRNDNAQGEFYLTDTIGILRENGGRVAAYRAPGDASEVMGVNTVEQLVEADLLLRERENSL